MSHPYQYVVLRYVPRVDRGECLNVGVVVHSQSAGVLRCAWHVDADRLRVLDPELDVAGLEAALGAVDTMCGTPPAEADAVLATQGTRSRRCSRRRRGGRRGSGPGPPRRARSHRR